MKKGHIKIAAGLAAVIGFAGFAANASYAATSTTDVNVTVGSVIAMGATSAINIDLSAPAPASAGGSYASGTGEIEVITNDISGYSVYLTSNSATTSLNHSNPTVTSKVDSIAASTTLTSGKFSTTNTWGWSADGTTFNPVLAKNTKHSATAKTLFRQTSSPAISGEKSGITIGVTGDSSLVSGTYSGTLLFTAVPNSNTAELQAVDSTK